MDSFFKTVQLEQTRVTLKIILSHTEKHKLFVYRTGCSSNLRGKVDLPPVTVPVVKLLFAAPLGQPLHFVEA